jgi:hypothetical protein
MWSNLATSHMEGADPFANMLIAGDSLTLEDAVKFRDSLVKKMTRQQLAEGQKLTREWKPRPER